MKLIIAGGRNYKFTSSDKERLNKIFEEMLGKSEVIEVISGCCSGADHEGELWANSKNVNIRKFPPDWMKYGRAAGPIRNEEMAKYADAVALFPGGKGTESMYNLSKKYKLTIYDFRGL